METKFSITVEELAGSLIFNQFGMSGLTSAQYADMCIPARIVARRMLAADALLEVAKGVLCPDNLRWDYLQDKAYAAIALAEGKEPK